MTDTDLERRLRRALADRASAITSQDLRAAAVPLEPERHRLLRRWWLPLSAGFAAAAVSVAALVLLQPGDPAAPPPVAPGSSLHSVPASPPSPAATPLSGVVEPTPTSGVVPTSTGGVVEPTSTGGDVEPTPTGGVVEPTSTSGSVGSTPTSGAAGRTPTGGTAGPNRTGRTAGAPLTGPSTESAPTAVVRPPSVVAAETVG